MALGQPDAKEPIQVDDKLLEISIFQIQNLQGLIQLADSKAQFILAGNTVLVSLTIILFPDMRNIFLTKELFLILIYMGILGVFVIATLISMIQAFLVVYPRRSTFFKEKSHASIFYFQEIAHVYNNSDEYNEALLSSSLKDILTDAGSEIYGISVRANRKYSLLRLSIRWLISAVIFWVLLLVVTLLFPL